MSNNPSAKAAQQIGHLFESRWARREAEPVLPVEIETIIQQAIDASLRARDAEIEGLAKRWKEGPITHEDCRHCCADELLAITKEQP